MKNQWLAISICALALQAGALMPASAEYAADKAYHKQHQANKDSDKAALARADAHAEERNGHGLMAAYDRHKSRRASAKAYKHSQEAKVYRSIARHGN